MSALTKIFGTHSDRELKRITPLVDKVESYRDGMKALSDEELRGKTKEYKERLEKGETLDDLLPEAYATVREAASRVLGMEHYRVQIIGGIILHQGRIAEMKTGEGKTLVATLPSYLNALEGKTNQDDQQHQSQITRIIKNVTKIIEDYFGIVLDKNDFNYFRFKIHLKYYVLRKENNEEFMDGNIDELYDNMKNTYPDIYNCVYNIDQYLYKEFKKSCTSNELLYLMIHVTRLCTREDCNRKGITSA